MQDIFNIFLMTRIHKCVGYLMILYCISRLIICPTLLNDCAVMAHYTRINIYTALAVEDQGEGLIPDHSMCFPENVQF